MASDEIVWQIINQQFCSYKLSTPKTQTFCRNTDNVTGLCNRQSCPLANSRYATIRSSPSTGALYLCMKTIERAHTPARLWERIKLSKNYTTALAQIDTHLSETHVWPKFLIHKCKQRLTRLTQVAIRTRRLAKEAERMGGDLDLVPKLAPKVRRREATRERKAEAAARVERAIERELVERLRSGAYGDRPLNVEEGVWKRVLRGLEREGEGVRDRDSDDEEEEEDEEEWEMEKEREEEGSGMVEYVSDEGEDEESVGDLEEWLGSASEASSQNNSDSDSDENESGSIDEEDFTTTQKGKRKRDGEKKPQTKKKPKRKLEIEYEDEVVPREREAVTAR